jgi:hypothetical protein
LLPWGVTLRLMFYFLVLHLFLPGFVAEVAVEVLLAPGRERVCGEENDGGGGGREVTKFPMPEAKC